MRHGDMLDACSRTGSAVTTTSMPANSCSITEAERLLMDVAPNPSATVFTVHVTGSTTTEAVQITIIDGLGRTRDTKRVSANTTLQIGGGYHPGIYYTQAFQGAV